MKKKNLLKGFVVAFASVVTLGIGMSVFGGAMGTLHASPVPINSTTFPDDIFRSVVLSTYDYNHNGYLEDDEILMTRNIVCEYKGVSSVKGIEYFTEMQGLWVMNNNITELDVSKNVNLHGIWCSDNPIKHIDLSHNPELEWIYCFDCDLEELDVTHNPNMAFIEANTNPKIKELDVTKCPKLEHLTIGSCDLESIDLSNCPRLAHLDIFRNPRLKSLDVTCCPKMKRLDIWDNPYLSNVDVSKCPELQYYNCAHNNVTSLDVTHNPELFKLNCAYNPKLTSIDVSKNPKLSCLYTQNCGLTSLDISHNPRVYFLYAAMNPFTTLDIGYNPFLVKTYNEARRMDDIKGNWHGYEWIIDYGGDTSTGGDNIFTIWLNADVQVDASPKGSMYEVIPYDDCSDVTDGSNLMTREEFMQILYEMAGKPDVSGLTTRFKDVEPGSYYENAVKWGEAKAIAAGYPHLCFDTFGVGKYIRREDALMMLMRYCELNLSYKRSIDFGRSDDYIDYFDIDYEHWEAICWCATQHIIEGTGGATKDQQRIYPLARATRSDIQTMLDNFYEVNGFPGRYIVPNSGPTPTPQAKPSEVRAFVERFYKVVLGRAGDEKGINDWTNSLLSKERAGADVAAGFALSDEFVGKNLPADQFLITMYRAFFDREPDTDGYNLWMTKLNNGESREYVIAGFVNSIEFKNLCARYGINPGEMSVSGQPGNKPANQGSNQNNNTPSGNPNNNGSAGNSGEPDILRVDSSNADRAKVELFVERLYVAILGRPGDEEGVNNWTNIIMTSKDPWGNPYDAPKVISNGFFLSDEYLGYNTTNEEFLTDCYKAFFNREPDTEGYNLWLGKLNSNELTRRQVIEQGFGKSEEFRNLLTSYGFNVLN